MSPLLARRSPLICSATFTGLTPGASYSYTITSTATVSGASTTYTTSAAQIAGGALAFVAPAAASAAGAPSPSYPVTWAVTADVGMTYDTSETVQYIAALGASVGGVHGVLMAGDITYADNVNSNQAYWDAWATLWQPVTGSALLLTCPGNHEGEQGYSSISNTDNSATYGYKSSSSHLLPFQARDRAGAD